MAARSLGRRLYAAANALREPALTEHWCMHIFEYSYVKERRLITPDLIPAVAARFKALGDPGRLGLLAELHAGEKSVTELVAATARHPDHERDPDLAVEHVGDRRGVVDDLVEGEQREVDRHQLDDRSQPAHCGADAGADDRVLGDRHVADAALAEAKGHFRSGDFGHSAALYKRVVELSPKNAEGYIGLSASYDRLRRFDLSDRVYTALFQITGGTAQYYNNVGYSYMLRGNVSAALTNFRKAQQLDPDNVVVANNIQMLTNAVATSQA